MAEEPGVWSAYVGAVMRIEAPGGVFWVRPAPPASTTGEYPDPEGRPIYVLTAHNPGGQVVPDAANTLAEKRLTAELERRRLTWWPAVGGDPSWTHVEPGAAMIDVDEDDLLALGAEFGQDAIFVLTPADRRIVSCTGKRVTVTGWSSERALPDKLNHEYGAVSLRINAIQCRPLIPAVNALHASPGNRSTGPA